MGGGPHIMMSVSAAGEGKWSLIISALMKPLLYFQSANNNTNEDSTNEIIEVWSVLQLLPTGKKMDYLVCHNQLLPYNLKKS